MEETEEETEEEKEMKIMGYIIMVLATAVLCVLQIKNPDMTQTRFFIEYWHFLLGWLVAATAGSLLIIYGREREK